MLLIIKLLLIASFLFLAYQDFKDKSFFTFLPFLILILGIVFLFLDQDQSYGLFVLKYNFIFVALLLLIGGLMTAMKHGDFSTVKQAVGMGDVLILFAIIPLFSPTLFRLVFIASAITGILLALIYTRIKHKTDLKIPFAGLLSVIAALLIIIENWTKLSLHEPSIEL